MAIWGEHTLKVGNTGSEYQVPKTTTNNASCKPDGYLVFTWDPGDDNDQGEAGWWETGAMWYFDPTASTGSSWVSGTSTFTGNYGLSLDSAEFKVNGVRKDTWSTFASWQDTLVDNDMWPHGQYADVLDDASHSHAGYPPTVELTWNEHAWGNWTGVNPNGTYMWDFHSVIAAAEAAVKGFLDRPH